MTTAGTTSYQTVRKRTKALARAEQLFAFAAMKLPPPAMRLIAGKPVVVDGYRLHAEIQLLLALRRARKAPALCAGTLAQMRRRYHRDCTLHQGAPVAVGAVRDLSIEADRVPTMRARHYAPSSASKALLVFFHGGGFVIGDLETHDLACRVLCRDAGVHVLSVAYRLAPESPYPAPLDDALAAFRWARAHAADLGVDAKCIGVGGDSAGGHLSAVVAQDLIRAGEDAPAFQLLLYPAICRREAWPSLASLARGFFIEKRDIDEMERYYTGHLDVSAHDDPRLRPLDALAVLSAPMPNVVVVTCGFDPLRDEGEAYARAVRARGDRVIAKRFDGLVHGFINIAGVSGACRAALVDVAHMLREVAT